MELTREVFALFFFAFGMFFTLVGVVGILRLPDAFSRLHASGKVGTLGLLGLLIGVGVIIPGSIFKLVVLGLFVAIVAPVNSHAIAKADKEYTIRQQRQRDSSISAAGQQPAVDATTEVPVVKLDQPEVG
jgi:multicomponent Na+:H+ antiporter subunit G